MNANDPSSPEAANGADAASAATPRPSAGAGRAGKDLEPGMPSCPTPTCAPRPKPRTPGAAPRKRNGKARKFAVESFAESLLPVRDSLEAAIAIPAATPEQLLEGVHATLRQLTAALERNKVVEVNPAGRAPSSIPHQHQAISVVPAAQEPNTVVAVLQKGYLIADRVLRPALVTVSAPAERRGA